MSLASARVAFNEASSIRVRAGGTTAAGPSLRTMSTRKYTIRLDPTPKQTAVLWQYAGARRFVWNWALNRIQQWHEAGEKLNWAQLNHDFVQLRATTEWLKQLNSHNTRSALYDLKIAMQAFFKRVKQGVQPAGFPRFKSRYDSKQGFFIPELATIQGRRLVVMGQRIKLMRDCPDGVIGRAVRIKCVAGKWYVSITVTRPDEAASPVAPVSLVGIDIGLSRYATLSDGTTIENPRFFRQIDRRLAHWQRKLARQKKKEVNGATESSDVSLRFTRALPTVENTTHI